MIREVQPVIRWPRLLLRVAVVTAVFTLGLLGAELRRPSPQRSTYSNHCRTLPTGTERCYWADGWTDTYPEAGR